MIEYSKEKILNEMVHQYNMYHQSVCVNIAHCNYGSLADNSARLDYILYLISSVFMFKENKDFQITETGVMIML